MKRIGFDARFYSPTATGIGRHVAEVIIQLSLLDPINEYVIFLGGKDFQRNSKIIKNLGKNFHTEKALSPHYSFKEQTNFLRRINAHEFDLMIFPQFNVPLFYKLPYIVTIHDLTIHQFPGKKSNPIKHFIYKKIIQNAANKSQKILAVSTNTKEDIIKILKINPEKIDLVYNGISQNFHPEIDITTLKNFREKYKLPEKYFLYTGVMRSHKNVKGLIKAYKKFLKNNKENSLHQGEMSKGQRGLDVHLVLAGPKDDLYYPELKSLAEELNIEENIHFTGFFPEEDFSSLFSAATAFIFPSFYEGFGIPPLEAMSVNLPVACANTSSLPEVCEDAVLYFDPKNTDDMAQKMEEILEEKTQKKLMKKGQKQWKKFSWEKVGKKYHENIQSLLFPK